jgi:hypothetical protein
MRVSLSGSTVKNAEPYSSATMRSTIAATGYGTETFISILTSPTAASTLPRSPISVRAHAMYGATSFQQTIAFFSEIAIWQNNSMTNVLPQAANMNRGAWLQTEEIVECHRDIDELLVIGGVIWGNNPADDFFLESHGVRTPDAFLKVIIREGRVIAWIIRDGS